MTEHAGGGLIANKITDLLREDILSLVKKAERIAGINRE
jgi:hypothetical protein